MMTAYGNTPYNYGTPGFELNETRAFPFYGGFGYGFPGYGFGFPGYGFGYGFPGYGFGYGFRPWFRPFWI